jgi:hypothetical protein
MALMAKATVHAIGSPKPSRPWEAAAEKEKAALRQLRRKQIAIGAGAGVLGIALFIGLLLKSGPATATGKSAAAEAGGLQAKVLLLPTANAPLIAIRIVNTSSDAVDVDRVLLNGEFAAVAIDEREEASGFKRDAFPAHLGLGNYVTVAVRMDGVPVEGEFGTYYGKDVTFVEVVTVSSGKRRLTVPPPPKAPQSPAEASAL